MRSVQSIYKFVYIKAYCKSKVSFHDTIVLRKHIRHSMNDYFVQCTVAHIRVFITEFLSDRKHIRSEISDARSLAVRRSYSKFSQSFLAPMEATIESMLGTMNFPLGILFSPGSGLLDDAMLREAQTQRTIGKETISNIFRILVISECVRYIGTRLDERQKIRAL